MVLLSMLGVALAAPVERAAESLVVIHRVTPAFPGAARGLAIDDARCDVALVIGADGTPESVVPADDCPVVFRESAAAAILQWRFEPVMVDGQVVPAATAITVRYRLRGGGSGEEAGEAGEPKSWRERRLQRRIERMKARDAR